MLYQENPRYCARISPDMTSHRSQGWALEAAHAKIVDLPYRKK
jgi:hypothetical protein